MPQDPLTPPRDEPADALVAPPSGEAGPSADRPSARTAPLLPERPEQALPERTRQDEASPGLGALLAPGPTAPARAPVRREAAPLLPSAAHADRPDPHAAYLACRHFGTLDGLRAVGILAVVWHHTVGGPGRFGANLFFLLSGFLVTTIFLRERARKGTLDVARFRSRRARRLYPLYFTVLLAYVGLVWLVEPAGAPRRDFFAHLPAFATFTSNLFVELDREHVIFYFAWSLAAQEQFYLLWPLYLKHLTPRACAGALVSLLATAYLTRAGALDLALPQGGVLRTLVLSLMPALMLGALAGLTLHARTGFELVRRGLGSRWASSALLAAALVLWRTPSAPEPLMHVVLAALTVACVLREDHWLARLLRRPFLVHVGTVSYGIYLLHMLCHNVAERVLASLGTRAAVLDFALTAALAVGLGTLSHRYFEQRFLPADKRRPAASAG